MRSILTLSFVFCATFSLTNVDVAASLLRTYDEGTEGANNDNFNHRMENAFKTDNSDWNSASAGDYVDIKGYGRFGGSFNDFGDTFRVYLFAGVTYRAWTNPLDRYSGNSTPPSDAIDDTTLTVVDGGQVDANDDDFDFAANGYKFVGANDNGGLANQFSSSSSVEFTAAREGYYYFFVSESNLSHGQDTASSVSFDATNNFSNGFGSGLYGGVDGGMYVQSDGITPTGSVKGDLEADHFYWLRIEQLGGDSQPVPEPSSIAIFSVVGVGGLLLRRRMKAKNRTAQ